MKCKMRKKKKELLGFLVLQFKTKVLTKNFEDIELGFDA